MDLTGCDPRHPFPSPYPDLLCFLAARCYPRVDLVCPETSQYHRLSILVSQAGSGMGVGPHWGHPESASTGQKFSVLT